MSSSTTFVFLFTYHYAVNVVFNAAVFEKICPAAKITAQFGDFVVINTPNNLKLVTVLFPGHFATGHLVCNKLYVQQAYLFINVICCLNATFNSTFMIS